MARLCNKSIFIHIPQTGGSTVYSILKKLEIYEEEAPTNTGHPTIQMLKDSKYWEKKPFKFCFVRNPVSWYKSFWAHPHKDEWVGKESNIGKLKYESIDFEEFVHKCYSYYKREKAGPMNLLFYEYYCEVDFIGKLENLRKDLITALTLAGEKIYKKKSIINNTPRQGVNSYFRKPKCPLYLKDIILETEKEFIEKFY